MSRHDLSIRSSLPLLGALASAVLFGLASMRYPGGYDWIHQSVSTLFQPRALNGTVNASRSLAALAVLVFCVSIALVFHTISRSGPSKFHRKTIQIAGIGSMVYTALVVTPMHDVLVGVALIFFVTAMGTIFHRLYLQRRWAMLASGLACITLTLCNAAMYYGDLLYGFLPIVQKLSLVLWVVWLLGLYFMDVRVGDRAKPHNPRLPADETLQGLVSNEPYR